jgi:hypothetical protein
MENKRGQGLSTNAIILIVLGVIVLVILAVGFFAGWETIAPWISTNNVNTIAQQCSVACSTNSVYDYCTSRRTLKADNKKIEGTCEIFSIGYQYGIESCPNLCETKKECEKMNFKVVGEVDSISGKPVKRIEGCGDGKEEVMALDTSGIDMCCAPKNSQLVSE